MLRNPFTPAEIASSPDDFFGRTAELSQAKQALSTGSVSIQGPIGIGKSSLLARTRLEMEGYDSTHTATTVIAIGHREISSADELARSVLEDLIEIDEKQKKLTLKLGTLAEFESTEIYRNFVAGRHVAALSRLLEREYLKQMLNDRELLIIAIDEADKCPVPLTRLVRLITTYAQQNGIKGVRFLLAGVSPFYQQMLSEDPGISRFIYKTIMLAPMTQEDATDLIETKLGLVTDDARKQNIDLTIDTPIISRAVALSGGHPHLLQLLGSYLVENENRNPDGEIGADDLTTALRRICYEDRAQVYDSTLHKLEVEGQLQAFQDLMSIAPSAFPTRIPKADALGVVNAAALHWMFEHNILAVCDDNSYCLADEFLRIRLLMDGTEEEERRSQIEQRLLSEGWVINSASDLL
jgi:hypothetical protein